MRALWTGSLSFGLVNIPVHLYGASQSHSINFDLLHEKDRSPIRYTKICAEECTEVDSNEIVRGYEYAKGDYVIIDDEDFERAQVEKSGIVEIISFVEAGEVDPIYFEKPYYLTPDEGGEHAYVLLAEAMNRSGRAAVVRFVLRHREHIGAVLPVMEKGEIRLILHQLRFQDEIKQPKGLAFPSIDELHGIPEGEIDIALSLIDQLSGTFEPEAFKDPYRETLNTIIAEKLAGKKPKAAKAIAPEPTNVTDLMNLLKASLNRQARAGARKPAGSKRRVS